MPAKTSTKRGTCRHEAGHALVALLVGYLPILEVRVYRKRGREWAGETKFHKQPGDVEMTEKSAAKSLMVVVAGVLADAPSLDADSIAEALPDSDLLPFVFLRQFLETRCGLEAPGILVEETKSLLVLHEDVLSRLAKALFRSNRLSGDEIARMCDVPRGEFDAASVLSDGLPIVRHNDVGRVGLP